MSDGVIIALIICATAIILAFIGRSNQKQK